MPQHWQRQRPSRGSSPRGPPQAEVAAHWQRWHPADCHSRCHACPRPQASRTQRVRGREALCRGDGLLQRRCLPPLSWAGAAAPPRQTCLPVRACSCLEPLAHCQSSACPQWQAPQALQTAGQTLHARLCTKRDGSSRGHPDRPLFQTGPVQRVLREWMTGRLSAKGSGKSCRERWGGAGQFPQAMLGSGRSTPTQHHACNLRHSPVVSSHC